VQFFAPQYSNFAILCDVSLSLLDFSSAVTHSRVLLIQSPFSHNHTLQVHGAAIPSSVQNVNCQYNIYDCWVLMMDSTTDYRSTYRNAANLHHWVNLVLQQASDARLEIAILSGVDERVDAAVEEHQHYGKVVEPTREVDIDYADRVQEEGNLIDWPACDESTADHQWRHQSVASCCVQAWTRSNTHLKQYQTFARFSGFYTNTNRYWTKAIWPVYPDLSVILQGSTSCYDVKSAL